MSKVRSQKGRKNEGEQKDLEYYKDSRLIKKVSLDYEVERKRRRKTIKMEKLASLLSYEVKYYLDFDRRLNIPDQVVFHLFVWFYTLISVLELLVYEFQIFGTYNKDKGLTAMYAHMYPAPGVVALYLWYPMAG